MGSTDTHRIIQIKDLDLEERFKSAVIKRGSVPYVWPDSLCQVTPAEDAERYLVGQGDVLFLSLGQRPYAVSVLQPLENMVTSYHFYSFPTCHVKASGDVWRHVPLGTPGSSPAPYVTLERGVPRAGAVLSPRKNAWPSVSTSQRGRLYILRSDADRVDPAYLAWFMNQATARRSWNAGNEAHRSSSSPNLLLRNWRWSCHHWPRSTPSSR